MGSGCGVPGSESRLRDGARDPDLETRNPQPDPDDRYSRQVLFAPVGAEGQRRIRRATCVVVGCGALGSFQAEMLARAGVGRLRLVDRDEIELSNLQRQVLFTEADVADGLPKALAAARHLRQANAEVALEPIVADLGPDNAEKLLDSATVVLDGTDNYETRELINEVCVKTGVPWIYGGCVGSEGTVLGIVPGQTPCLACQFGEAPAPGQTPTCETAGVIAPAVAVVAGLQVAEALKVLSGHAELLRGTLLAVDVWTGRLRALDVSGGRDPDCEVCGKGHFARLDGGRVQRATTLCGRGVIQIVPAPGTAPVELAALEARLRPLGRVTRSAHLLRAEIGEHRLTVFPDGRALIKGARDTAVARSLYAKYIGV